MLLLKVIGVILAGLMVGIVLAVWLPFVIELVVGMSTLIAHGLSLVHGVIWITWFTAMWAYLVKESA